MVETLFSPKCNKRKRELSPNCGSENNAIIELGTKPKDRYLYAYACTQQQCPAIRKRLMQHQKKHSVSTGCSPTNIPISQDGELRRGKLFLGQTSSADYQRQEGDPSLIMVKRGSRIFIQNGKPATLDDVENRSSYKDKIISRSSNPKSANSTEIKLSRTETRDVLEPKANFFREYLNDEILHFLQIPYDNFQRTNVMSYEVNVVRSLVDRILELSVFVDDDSFEDQVRDEVMKVLKVSPYMQSANNNNQDICRTNFIESLIQKVKKLKYVWLFNDKLQRRYYDFTKVVDNVNKIDAGNHPEKKKVISRTNNCNELNEKASLNRGINNSFQELPCNVQFPRNKLVYLNKLAEDLVDKLLSEQPKIENIIDVKDLKVKIKQIIIRKSKMFKIKEHTVEQIAEILEENFPFLQSGKTQHIVADISDVLRCASKYSDAAVLNFAHYLVAEVKNYIVDLPKFGPNYSFHSGTFIVQQSQHDLSGPSFNSGPQASSTPRASFETSKNDIPKQNPEERQYKDRIAEIIRFWLDTLDVRFETTEDQMYKETITKDLAGDITDAASLAQMNTKLNYEEILGYVIIRSICKYTLLNVSVINTDAPQVVDLKNRIKQIPIPNMTLPYHGNRQMMANIKFSQNNPTNIEFQPKAIDILEDNISVWMNEQRSDIDHFDDKYYRNKLVHEIAKTAQQQMVEGRSESEIKIKITDWLSKIVKPDSIKNIDKLSENLKTRIVSLPKDETLFEVAKYREKAISGNDTNISHYTENEAVTEQYIQEYINKFIEHNYDTDDTLAKSAFGQLLLEELRKIIPPIAYENDPPGRFSPEKFHRELQYIKEISDWLKMVPLDQSIKQGRDMIKFVNELARKIVDIEEERFKRPNVMDYDVILRTELYNYIKKLSVAAQHPRQLDHCVDQLLDRIVKLKYNYSNHYKNDTLNNRDFIQFLEQYMNTYGAEIVDDPLTRKAWFSRLYEEIRKILRDVPEINMNDSLIYKGLAEVPVPRNKQLNNSVRRLSMELGYAKEISDWLNNFPSLPITNKEDNEKRIKMICHLSEKLAEIDRIKEQNPNDPKIDFDGLVTKWITELPLEPGKEIVVSILISQLRNRIDNLVKQRNKKWANVVSNTSYKDVNNTNKRRSDCCSLKYGDRPPCCNSPSFNIKPENPGILLVSAIDKWCQNLPFTEKSENDTQAIKNEIATKLFQKVGALTEDPNVTRDDLLYRDMIADEIDTQLDNLPDHPLVQQNKEALKKSLLEEVVDAKKLFNEKSAGEAYQQALNDTIDASIPCPILGSQNNEPGFQLFKNRITMLFILENYDYTKDLKYIKQLNADIDILCQEAQKKNAVPLDKDKIINEITTALLRVSPPNERAMIEEVEIVKTRCEIESWRKELPMQEPNGVDEILFHDQIFSLLTKKIHAIEKNSKSHTNEKMLNEIIRLLKKLPLFLEKDKNEKYYAKKLINSLKASADARKCKVLNDLTIKKTTSKINNIFSRKSSRDLIEPYKRRRANTSQIAGPSRSLQPKSISREKPSELISRTVENWCNTLPLTPKNIEDKEILQIVKNELVIKIFQILSDLHNNPEILNNPILYEDIVKDNIDRLLEDISECCECVGNKIDTRKMDLIKDLKALRPLVKDELDREGYKQQLKRTVDSFLESTLENRKSLINQDNLIDSFIEYIYNTGSYEDKQFYKHKIQDAFIHAIMKPDAKNTNEVENPLITSNELICKLSKLPLPSDDAIQNTVQEIRIKHEVDDFFNKIGIPNNDSEKPTKRDTVRDVLAKKMNHLENTGDDIDIIQKMAIEVEKACKKLDGKVNRQKCLDFAKKLAESKAERNAVPQKKASCCLLVETPSIARNYDQDGLNRTHPFNLPSKFKTNIILSYPQRHLQFPHGTQNASNMRSSVEYEFDEPRIGGCNYKPNVKTNPRFDERYLISNTTGPNIDVQQSQQGNEELTYEHLNILLPLQNQNFHRNVQPYLEVPRSENVYLYPPKPENYPMDSAGTRTTARIQSDYGSQGPSEGYPSNANTNINKEKNEEGNKTCDCKRRPQKPGYKYHKEEYCYEDDEDYRSNYYDIWCPYY